MSSSEEPDVPIREAAENGILMALVEYQCRVCTTRSNVYCRVRVDDSDAEPYINADRLHTGRCRKCRRERTHVFSTENVRERA